MICSSLLAKAPGNHIKVCVPYFLTKRPLRVEEFVQNFHYPLSPPLSSPLSFLSTAPCFPVSSPHALTHTRLNFLFFPPLQRCYRGVSVTADHQSGGSAGHFRSRRGSQLAQRLQPAPRLQSQAPLRPCPRQGWGDTWPNHRNTSSCRLPDAHHGENPGQRWRSSPRTTAPPHAFLRISAILIRIPRIVFVRGGYTTARGVS